MAETWRQGKLEHRNAIVKKQERKSEMIKNTVAMGTITKKGSSITELLGDMDLSVIRELSLCSKHLTYISEELGVCLSNLVYLDLSNNKLKTVPCSLQNLVHLKSLILDKNYLKTIPPIIMKISALQVLGLSRNGIESLPNNLGDLKCLETLNLSSNCLSDLPESCNKLNHLKSLDLSGNSFNALPCCITRGMRSLETLDVSNNLYINTSMAPASKKLKKLYIRKAGIKVKFPGWLVRGRAPSLEVLDCDGTRFKYFNFPENTQSLKLRRLSLESCCIYDKFAEEITSHTDELETLRVGNGDSKSNGNAFWKMPITNLKRPMLVTEISVRGTGLPSVCQEIGNFVNLVKLDIGNNNIYWLPNEICLLSNLDVLLVDANELCTLPDNIGHMTSLKELKANGNHIATLPQSIGDLKHLSYLDLYDNELGEVPHPLHSMKNLLGVDVDQNSFDVSDLCVRKPQSRDLQYEILRSTLRDRYKSQGCLRLTGPRYESDAEEMSDTSSRISSIACDDRDAASVQCGSEHRVNDSGTNVEESWDVSDNSADEFDPNNRTNESRREPVASFSYVLPERLEFCPADLHKIPTRQQVALMKQRGEIKDNFDVEEGQFEDA